MGLGEALFRSRDYEAAMATLKPLLNSSSAEAQFLYGASLLNLQQPVEAIPYLREAIARDARLPAARAALGQALLQTGKSGEAIPLLEGALSADEDGSTHFQLFRAYQLTHRDADARRALAEFQRFRASLAPRP
jgi:predicted Zn-dependent protease